MVVLGRLINFGASLIEGWHQRYDRRGPRGLDQNLALREGKTGKGVDCETLTRMLDARVQSQISHRAAYKRLPEILIPLSEK